MQTSPVRGRYSIHSRVSVPRNVTASPDRNRALQEDVNESEGNSETTATTGDSFNTSSSNDYSHLRHLDRSNEEIIEQEQWLQQDLHSKRFDTRSKELSHQQEECRMQTDPYKRNRSGQFDQKSKSSQQQQLRTMCDTYGGRYKTGPYVSNRQRTAAPSQPPHSCFPTVPGFGSMWFYVPIALVLIGLSAFALFTDKETKPKSCSYAELHQRYAEQDEILWLSLKVGIENILNGRSDKPCVYLFVHQGGVRMHRLVEDIAAQSSQCFGGPKQLIKMPQDQFTSPQSIEDYGLAIEEYKSRIKHGHVVLIANLNKIPAETAPALHTICDIYSPIAKDVIIILTLEAPKTDGNPTATAMDALVKLWGDKLPRNELDPLITRVTDQVIALRS